jgi:hypothetical protein
MRTTLTFAGLWHLLWAAFLVPYAVVIALILGGQASAQDLAQGLALHFGLAVICVVAGLVLNLGLAALLTGLLAEAGASTQVLVAAVIFGLVWFLAIQDLLPYLDLGSGGGLNPAAPWAGIAGAAYGVVLSLGFSEASRSASPPSAA